MPKSDSFIADVDRIIHKVNAMNIDRGATQYSGRGEDSSEEAEVETTTETIERPPENIYDTEEDNSLKAARDIMADVLKRSEYINEGEQDLPKLVKQLKKVRATMGGMVKKEKGLKDHLKALKETDPKLYYKVKAKLDNPKKGKGKSKGGARPKKPASEKQKAWMAMVDKVKAKHPELSRKECMKIASDKRKSGNSSQKNSLGGLASS